MGLPLAPEIARVVTAFQVDTRLNLVPPVAVSLYFNNLYATHDPTVMLPVFSPFNLTEEPFNTLQNAGYHHTIQEFCPNPTEVRTPIPIHPHSYHPHRRMIEKSYLSTVPGIAIILSDSNIALHTFFREYPPFRPRSDGRNHQSSPHLFLSNIIKKLSKIHHLIPIPLITPILQQDQPLTSFDCFNFAPIALFQ